MRTTRAAEVTRPNVLLLLLGLVLAACSAEHAHVREKGRQQEALTETVEAYWHAVRWGYVDRAVVFVERPEQQGELAEYLDARRGTVTLEDVRLYHLALDEDLKGATAFVSYQLLVHSDPRLVERRARQRWVNRGGGRWFLTLSPEEFTWLEPQEPEGGQR